MQATRFIDLMRHGETVGGAGFRGSTEAALSERGWAQMRTAVDNQPAWDRIISSPLSRCADFARTLEQQHDIGLQFDARIQEIHFGEWEGQTAETLMQTDAEALTRYWQDPTQYTPPEGEALTGFNTRVLSFWQELIEKPVGEKILLVTHGGVIRVLLCHVLQRPLQHLLEFEIGHATIQRIRIEHTPRGLRTTHVGASA